VKFQSSQAKQKRKFPPKFDKILGCYTDAIIVVCASKVTQLGVLRITHFSKIKTGKQK
jgi:hypothetical protein